MRGRRRGRLRSQVLLGVRWTNSWIGAPQDELHRSRSPDSQPTGSTDMCGRTGFEGDSFVANASSAHRWAHARLALGTLPRRTATPRTGDTLDDSRRDREGSIEHNNVAPGRWPRAHEFAESRWAPTGLAQYSSAPRIKSHPIARSHRARCSSSRVAFRLACRVALSHATIAAPSKVLTRKYANILDA